MECLNFANGNLRFRKNTSNIIKLGIIFGNYSKIGIAGMVYV